MQNKDNRCFLYSIEWALDYDKIKRLHYMSSHYNSNIRILGTDGKEINSDIYNIIDEMIPEKKLINL